MSELYDASDEAPDLAQYQRWHANDQILFDEARDAVLQRDWAALDELFTVSVPEKLATDLCLCGHRREQHIYNEGACRPGFTCEQVCKQFVREAP